MKTSQRYALLAAPMIGAIATVLAATPAAAQQTIVIPAGTTSTTQRSVSGTDTVTVETGATLQTTTNPAINWNGDSTNLRITNSGTIRSTAAGGSAISTSGAGVARSITLTNNAGGLIEAQDDAFRIGVAATSGTIVVNNAGTMRSTGTGNAIDFAAITSATPTVTINNETTGVISTTGGTAILLGSGNDVVTNAGRISAGTTAINLGAGNDTLNLRDGSTIVGTIDGGAGTADLISLGGTNGGNFAGSVNVERLDVTSGTWAYSGTSAYSGGTFLTGGQLNVGGTLTSATTITGGTLNNTGTVTGASTITGGTFNNAGTLTGAAAVNTGGLLSNTGTITGAVTVNTGATYAGTGTATSLTANMGSTVSPGVGTGVGTLTTTGAVTFAAGSTYNATLASNGTSDRVVAGSTVAISTTAPGATLALSGDNGTYTLGSSYTVVSSGTGLTGSFTTVTQSAPTGLTEFRQRTTANDILVDVVRSPAGLRDGARGGTGPQVAIAAALSALPANANYLAVTALVADADVRSALDQLTGEIHASARTITLHDTLRAQQAVHARINGTFPDKITTWAQYGLSRGGDDARGFAGRVTRRNAIGTGGVEFPVGSSALVGISGVYSRSVFDIADRASEGSIESVGGAVYAAAEVAGFTGRISGGYFSADVTTRRQIVFTGLNEIINGRYTNRAIHGFAELAYGFDVGSFKVGPYGRATAIRLRTPDFTEINGSSALTGFERIKTTAISNVGISGKGTLMDRFDLRGAVGWRHGFGDLIGHTDFTFANGSIGFGTDGTSFSREAVEPSIDLSYRFNERVRLFAGYTGTFGDRGHDHNGRIGISATL